MHMEAESAKAWIAASCFLLEFGTPLPLSRDCTFHSGLFLGRTLSNNPNYAYLQGRGSWTALGGGAENRGILTNLDKGLGESYQEMAAFAGVKT